MTGAKTALITGASAGLGKEFARQLAAAGHDLVLVARRQLQLEDAAEALRAEHGVAVRTLPADLSRPEAPEQIYAATTGWGVTVDILINNAGSGGPDLINTRVWQANQSFLELMMISAAHLCHLYIPAMLKRGWGRVVNVSSVSARIPRAGGCNYGPSKAYLVALSEELALTLKPRGVKVLALCPGFTHTDFHKEGALKEMKARSPGFLWYPAETVVREGLAALERGRSVYVSGRLYRWLDPWFQSVWTRRLFKLRAAQ